MKRWVTWCGIMLLTLGLCLSVGGRAALAATDASYFDFDSSTGTITKYTGSDTVVDIPSTINGVAVTSLGAWCFFFCSSLTSITIPDSVTTLGNYCFDDCTGLTSITIPDSVASLGISCFYGCTGLTSITIPDAVTSLANYCFYGCTGLTSITIPDAVTSLGASCFSGCTGLTSITIPDAVTTLGRLCFKNCSSLTSITIPDAVTTLESSCFSGCTGLTSITLPDAVITLGSFCFSGCTSLTSITLPDAVTTLGSSCFSGCTGLTSITIPDAVTTLESSCFSGCTGLTSITLPDSVTTFGANCFDSCTSLTDVKVIFASGIDYGATAAYTISSTILDSGSWTCSNCSYSGSTVTLSTTTLGTQTATVSYGSRTVTFIYTVVAVDIEIAITGGSKTEGASGSTAIDFTVTLSAPGASAVTVAYATYDGTATAGSDYVAASGTLTFAAGETSQTISVTVNGDTQYEADEIFSVVLNNPTNASITTSTATGTIANDDSQPTVSVTADSASQTEGDSGTTAYSFTVSLSNASYQTITVAYATADNTATTADSDYTAASGTLTFSPGETSKQVSVTTNGDPKYESDESFYINLSNPVNATLATSQATGTITNDDSQPTVSIDNVTLAESDSGVNPFSFTVNLSNSSDQTVTVDYVTADGIATTADHDYTAASGTLTFSPGSTSQTVIVNVNGDTTVEADETFTVALTTPVNATLGTSASGIGTIQNDEGVATLGITGVTQAEGNSGTTTANFTVSLSQASSSIVTVAYITGDNTAAAGSDYTATSGTLTFAAGETSKTISVTINGDTQYEADETFYVTLNNPVNALIASSQATGTITGDDSQPTVSVTANVASQTEGNSGTTTYSFTVSLSNASYQAVTVAYATADNTATTADSDYTATSGTLSFAAGETSKTVSVNINGDSKYESDEAFYLNLSDATNATVATSQATGTILNDDSDAAPTLTAVIPSVGSDGVKLNASLTLTFSEAVSAGSGKIAIYKKGGTLVETIAASSTTISANVVTITPTNKLTAATDYYIVIDATAFQDTAGNAYAGISDTSAWSFTTVESAVTITFTKPVEGAKLNITTGSTVIVKLTENGVAIDRDTVTIRIDSGTAANPTALVAISGGYTLYYVITGIDYSTTDNYHTLTVSTDDASGATSSKTVSFTMEPKRNGFGFGRLRFD